MPRPSDARTPFSIALTKPSGPPTASNVITDRQANQFQLLIDADGAAVTFAAGAKTNILWYYDPAGGGRWRMHVVSWLSEGWTIDDGDGLSDLLRFPVAASAFHLQAIGGLNLGSASGFVVPIRGGT